MLAVYGTQVWFTSAAEVPPVDEYFADGEVLVSLMIGFQMYELAATVPSKVSVIQRWRPPESLRGHWLYLKPRRITCCACISFRSVFVAMHMRSPRRRAALPRRAGPLPARALLQAPPTDGPTAGGDTLPFRSEEPAPRVRRWARVAACLAAEAIGESSPPPGRRAAQPTRAAPPAARALLQARPPPPPPMS